MPLTAADSSVVVLGHWNRAILTPQGIARRLFGLDEKTPVEVRVAIDAPAPPQVVYEGTTVVVDSDKLVAQPEKGGFDGLDKAMEVARRAMEDLPVTPMRAAGINVKFRCEELNEPLEAILRNPAWDDPLSDKRYEILGREALRVLRWREGQINLSIKDNKDGTVQIQFNFHRGSTSREELTRWLSVPVADLKSQVDGILVDCIGITLEDIGYAAANAEV